MPLISKHIQYFMFAVMSESKACLDNSLLVKTKPSAAIFECNCFVFFQVTKCKAHLAVFSTAVFTANNV